MTATVLAEDMTVVQVGTLAVTVLEVQEVAAMTEMIMMEVALGTPNLPHPLRKLCCCMVLNRLLCLVRLP